MNNFSELLPQTEEELMPFLLKTFPGFTEAWQADRKSQPGEPPEGIYIDIAVFAKYVVDSYDKGDTAWYGDFFNFVENLITSGDEHMRELAVIGFLETIQTISSHRPHKGKVFLKWLSPISKKMWKNIDKLWARHGSLLNIFKAEIKQDRYKSNL